MARRAVPMSTALTDTPRMLTVSILGCVCASRWGASVSGERTATVADRSLSDLAGGRGPHLGFDPAIRSPQTLFQRDFGLPVQGLAKQRIVAVASPNPLRSGEVMPLRN